MSLQKVFGKSPGNGCVSRQGQPGTAGSVVEQGEIEAGVHGGAEGDRTPDPRLAKPVLSQLSYSPLAFAPYPAPGRLIAIVASLRGT